MAGRSLPSTRTMLTMADICCDLPVFFVLCSDDSEQVSADTTPDPRLRLPDPEEGNAHVEPTLG